MSLQPLLESKTLDESWSHLYCNRLTARLIDGGTFIPVLNGIANSAIVPVVFGGRAGVISNSQSLQTMMFDGDDAYVTLSGSFTWNAFGTSTLDGKTFYQLRITLPVKIGNFVNGTYAGGGTAAVFTDAGGIWFSTNEALQVSSGDLLLNVYFDTSTFVNGNSLNVNYTLTYKAA